MKGTMPCSPSPAQDSRLFSEGVLSRRPPPKMSPPSWLLFSLFSFSVGPRHSGLEPPTPALHP